MKRAILAIAFLGVACASARHQPEEPSTVPPPQPISATSPSVESQIANLQTSLTELLDRLDVLNARIAKVESGGQAPPPVPAA